MTQQRAIQSEDYQLIFEDYGVECAALKPTCDNGNPVPTVVMSKAFSLDQNTAPTKCEQ
jgi:hypothetical protein